MPRMFKPDLRHQLRRRTQRKSSSLLRFPLRQLAFGTTFLDLQLLYAQTTLPECCHCRRMGFPAYTILLAALPTVMAVPSEMRCLLHAR